MKKYIDTHAHLTGSYFKGDAREEIKNAFDAGLSHLIIPGTTVEDSIKAIELSKEYDNVFAAVGVHPSDVDKEDYNFINDINPDDIIAVGEIGLDLYHEDNPSIENQVKALKVQLDYAIKHDKVALIHMREAEKETYDVVKEYKGLKFIMHSYTGNLDWAKKFLELGAYISFSGIVTFKNAKEVQAVAKEVPLDRIVSETDTPFLAPTPKRGKPNIPAYVVHTIEFLGDLRDEDNETVVEQIHKNTIKLFGL